MRRLLAAALLSLLAALALAGPASADTGSSLERGRAEVQQASGLVDQALAAVKRGDRRQAYRLARSAYLDHFEYVEIPLRLRNPNLVLDTEFKFAELRNGIKSGAPVGEVRASAVKLRSQLLDVDRELASKGLAA